MATQTVEFRSPPSQTITAKLFAVGSDAEVASVSTTEATNRKGTYAAAYTDVPAGEYELIALVSTTPVARWFVTLTLTTATFQVYDKAQTVLMVADVINASALAADAVAEIQSGLAVGDVVSINGSTVAAANLALSAAAICTGTVGTEASTTSIPTSAFSPAVSAVTANQLLGRIVIFRRDTTTVALRGQATNIIASTASATPTLIVTALTVAPAVADVFVVV